MKKTKKFFFEKAQGACKRGTAAMLCIVLILLFAAGSCEKPPEKGIKYYNNIKGEGHVFYRYFNDSLVPSANVTVYIEASENLDIGMGETAYSHSSHVTTDENGRYTVQFVKSIDGNDMEEYWWKSTAFIYPPVAPEGFYFFMESGIRCSKQDILTNTNLIIYDTLFYELHPNHN
jgi:hypothetical protein